MRWRKRSTYSCSSFWVWADSTSLVRPTNLRSSVAGLGAGRTGVGAASAGSLPIGASSSAVASVLEHRGKASLNPKRKWQALSGSPRFKAYVYVPDSGCGTCTMVLLYEHWLVTETTLIALVDIVMSVRGAPTTAAAVGPTDTSLSNTTTGKRNKIKS